MFKANTVEDFYTLNIVSGTAGPGTHTLNIEYVRGLHSPDGKTITKVPQVFVYEMGPAEEGEGEGTDGLQILGVRCYYDIGLMERAAKAQGVETEGFRTA